MLRLNCIQNHSGGYHPLKPVIKSLYAFCAESKFWFRWIKLSSSHKPYSRLQWVHEYSNFQVKYFDRPIFFSSLIEIKVCLLFKLLKFNSSFGISSALVWFIGDVISYCLIIIIFMFNFIFSTNTKLSIKACFDRNYLRMH